MRNSILQLSIAIHVLRGETIIIVINVGNRKHNLLKLIELSLLLFIYFDLWFSRSQTNELGASVYSLNDS